MTAKESSTIILALEEKIDMMRVSQSGTETERERSKYFKFAYYSLLQPNRLFSRGLESVAAALAVLQASSIQAQGTSIR